MLAGAQVPMQIDVGFGDVIVPQAITVEYPTLLSFPAPVLMAYPKETVVAEKLEALTTLGLLNSRFKDYFDLWLLSQIYSFDGITLSKAIGATFRNRETQIEAQPAGLGETFGSDPDKQRQWAAFLRRSRFTTAPSELSDAVRVIRNFAYPPLSAAASGAQFTATWQPARLWVHFNEAH
jgi:hypothetical protein